MLTRRENLLAVLHHHSAEWIPICGHVDPYSQPNRRGMDPALAEALKEVKFSDESCIAFSRHLGIDVMDWYNKDPLRSLGPTVEKEEREEGDDRIVIWHTPKGDLQEVIRQNRKANTRCRIEHLIKRPEDLTVFASAIEDEDFAVDTSGLEHVTARVKVIGNDGVLAFSMQGTPLGMMIRSHAGVEMVAYLHADAPNEFRDFLSVLGANHERRYKLAAALPCDLLVGVDDTSTTTQSPAMFEAYCMDYTNRIADICHAQGKPYLHHSCGLIRDLLPLYRLTKMDGVHAYTIPPIGNATIRQGMDTLRADQIIFSGLSQISGDMSCWEAVAADVRQMFEEAAPGDRLILSLYPDPEKDMAITQRLLDEARKYQVPGGQEK